MKILIFIPPKGFKDESLATLKLFFDKWNVTYDVTSFSNKDCMGAHGAVAKIDVHTNKISISDYDGIILVDGKGNDELRLYEYRPLLDVLIVFNQRSKYVGAIGNSVKAMARANIIKDRKIAAQQDEETTRLVLLFHGVPTENMIEISSNIITIRNSVALEMPLQELLTHFGVK